MAAPTSPGSYDLLSREFKELFPTFVFYDLDTIKLNFVRNVSPHLQVTHTVSLGNDSAPDGYYKFAPTYVHGANSPNQTQQPKQFPVIVGEISNNGSLVAQIIHELGPLKLKFQGQTQKKVWQGAQVEFDYEGKDFAAGLKFVNVNPAKDSGIVLFNYFQKVTSKFDMGGEIVYQASKGHQNAAMTIGGRYRSNDWAAAASLTPNGVLNAFYFHRLNAKTAFGTELMLDGVNGDSIARAGYQYRFRSSIFSGMVTTKGETMACLEQEIFPVVSMTLLALLDHSTATSKFGVSVTVSN